MARPRQGIGFVHRGTVFTGVRLRDGGRAAWDVTRTDAPPAGVPLGVAWAKAVSLQYQARYDRGEWDPRARASAALASAPAAAPRTVIEVYRDWVKTLPRAQAVDDGRRGDAYLARAPLGAQPLADVAPADLTAFVAWLLAQPSRRGGTLAPRTVRNAFDAARRMFAWAASPAGGLLAASPCTAAPDNLPAIADKHREFRAHAVFARAEVHALLTDPRVPPDRRALYAVLLLTGCRFGEVAALRWRHWTKELEPLGRLLVAHSVERNTRAEKAPKTGVVREVPVHPALAAALAAWQADGWPATFGRAPALDDYLVPSREGRARSVRHAHTKLQEDLARLGLRGRRLHDTRRTFISLCRDDGARGEILRHVTHGASRASMMDVYSTLGWATYCAEVARLRFDLVAQPVPAATEGSVTGSVTTDDVTAEGETKNPVNLSVHGVSLLRGGRDSNPAAPHEPARNAANSPRASEAHGPNATPDGGFVTDSVTALTEPLGPLPSLFLAVRTAMGAATERGLGWEVQHA